MRLSAAILTLALPGLAWSAPTVASSVIQQAVITQGADIGVDVSRIDGRLAIDLLGKIWIVPATGGPATLVGESLLPARRPRWSPNGQQILFQTQSAGASRLWLADLESGEQQRVSDGDFFDRDAAWHPTGDRLVFSSARHDSGFDLWETDLQTGLQWRLSAAPGDETEPAWSASGRDLVYIRRDEDQWTLMLRRFGRADRPLVRSDSRLAAPSWRPDGTLVTYLREVEGRHSLQMAILSDPPLLREFAPAGAYSLSPISWKNREQLYFVKDGRIRTRGFDEWNPRTVLFRAAVTQAPPPRQIAIANRVLPLVEPADGRLVIRAGRLFDGFSDRYRNGVDVLLADGIIAEVTASRAWDGIPVIDLANTTLLPGLLDSYSRLPDLASEPAGAHLLSWGVTSLVTPDPFLLESNLWEGDNHPGPRVLRARNLGTDVPTEADTTETDDVFLWTVGDQVSPEQIRHWQAVGRPVLAESWTMGIETGTSLLLGLDALAALADRSGQRHPTGQSAGGFWYVSALADAGTPGLSSLFAARQAAGVAADRPAHRRSTTPDLRLAGSRIVAGSRPNGLPAGLALHAELRALAAAGLPGDKVLKAAGLNAARILGLSGQLGEISPGARADLILVRGDPLRNVADLADIVGVVRNGRFYSLISLLERTRLNVE